MANVALVLVGIFVGIIILGAAFVVLWKMLVGRIDLQYLISEADGSASISRFQLLIFTFVIGLSYFLFVICKMNEPGCSSSQLTLPDLPNGVLALLGISGGSYVLSKGIQKTAEVAGAKSSGGDPESQGGNASPAARQ